VSLNPNRQPHTVRAGHIFDHNRNRDSTTLQNKFEIVMDTWSNVVCSRELGKLALTCRVPIAFLFSPLYVSHAPSFTDRKRLAHIYINRPSPARLFPPAEGPNMHHKYNLRSTAKKQEARGTGKAGAKKKAGKNKSK
jgi:hypothetical protein